MKEMQRPVPVLKPVDWLKDRTNIRQDPESEGELLLLGESMLKQQISPVGAMSDGELIWGFRRTRAARMVGMKEILVMIFNEPLSQLDQSCYRLTENIHRKDLSPYEKFRACEQIKALNPNWSVKDLAEAIRVTPSTATKLMSPSLCIPAWVDALRDGLVTISDCYVGSQAPDSEQATLLALALSGANRNTLQKHVRDKKSSAQPGRGRVSRVSMAISGGVKVIVRGKKPFSLAEVADWLSECQEAARKGIKEKLEIRTWEKVLRDKWSSQGGEPNAV